MLIREIDHALTTIHCTLDGMKAIIQMFMEVQPMNADAVGYLLLGCISSIRQKSNTIEGTLKRILLPGYLISLFSGMSRMSYDAISSNMQDNNTIIIRVFCIKNLLILLNQMIKKRNKICPIY